MFTSVRLLSQQLYQPCFEAPEDLLDWMGAMQAQDYTKSKWAMGLRLQEGTLSRVHQAYEAGTIVRTHVLRPTWHVVAGKDIRWMLKLTSGRTRAALDSWVRSMGIPESLCSRCNGLLEKILSGQALTKQELAKRLAKENLPVEEKLMSYLLSCAETERIICSGPDRDGKATFALLEERVAPVPELTREESYALLALKYFRSHSPATLADFNWWSGLSLTEARKAIGLIRDQLLEESFGDTVFYVHESCGRSCRKEEVVHLKIKIMAISYHVVRRPDMRKDAPEGATLFYGQVRAGETVSYTELCELISLISTASKGDVSCVIDGLIQVMKQELLKGSVVHLGEFGKYRMVAGSRGVEEESDFNASLFKKGRIVFTPGTELQETRSKLSFRKLDVKTVEKECDLPHAL
ncbi:MAG: winged helix DNA-binding domain-containing protein [Tannerellaceae bacterium]|nr:winged helix DNA-binding domain-containing protein [Tannerellaceae bacterium]